MTKISKYPFILLTIYITCLLLTVCLANRLTTVVSITETGGIFIFPLIFPVLDIMGEVYGYSYPRFFIWIGVFAEFLFSILTIAVSTMPHPDNFKDAAAYMTVFYPTFRYVLSGLAGTICGEFINVYLLAKWKIKMNGRYFLMRSFVSTAIGQAILSFIVIFLMFIGKLPINQLLGIIVAGWAAKMVCAFIYVIPAWFVVDYLKKKENIDFYDTKTKFNPFKIAIE